MPYLDRNAVISPSKLTEYLLVPLRKDNKSQFLARAGYTLENWQQLEQDLRSQILPLEATPTLLTRYGQKYGISGELTGVNEISIAVTTIWIVQAGVTRFVTLFPNQKEEAP
ncbi:DUF6883 domain-containing protein [Leptolyngbya sp. FACHB-17]|uniref:DUF6883 domain-containing protein n=1 Tax=unclassified Leptolyngbya TaxID=2650499 RepID=UPI0016816951|nr:DUF6883 domain-containing protein [Leptolyngbya sp. FACHB-17]MBD2082083.1 hypothetical protein [Leptolyngbya sp. FACHB-17]